MHRFDYQFLADSLPANLLEIAGLIYDLRGKGEIRKMNNLHLFQELQHTAMVDSIQSSNAIEGIVTTAERVKNSSINNRNRLHMTSRKSSDIGMCWMRSIITMKI